MPIAHIPRQVGDGHDEAQTGVRNVKITDYRDYFRVIPASMLTDGTSCRAQKRRAANEPAAPSLPCGSTYMNGYYGGCCL